MESLAHIRETILSDNDLYEGIKLERGAPLPAEVLRLKEGLATEHNRSLRTLAESDNYLRPTRDECALAEQAGKREVLITLLDVLDDFDRALLHVGEASDAVGSELRLIRQRFNDVLHSHGVSPFDSEGKPFDPTVHEAMTMIVSQGDESGTVYAEERRGYLINGELLRPARVAVLK